MKERILRPFVVFYARFKFYWRNEKLKAVFLLPIGRKKNTSVQKNTLNPKWEAKDVSIPELNYSENYN